MLNYKKPVFWIVAFSIIAVAAACIGIALNPKPTEVPSNYVENLWVHRTLYIGDNSAVGNMINALEFPEGTTYDSFELHTSEGPYMLTINMKTDTETRNYYTGAIHETPFQINACILFSLIKNADYVTFNLNDGVLEPYSIQYTSDWADSIVGVDLWEESKTLDKFETLLTRIKDHVNSAIAPAEDVTIQ